MLSIYKITFKFLHLCIVVVCGVCMCMSMHMCACVCVCVPALRHACTCHAMSLENFYPRVRLGGAYIYPPAFKIIFL